MSAHVSVSRSSEVPSTCRAEGRKERAYTLHLQKFWQERVVEKAWGSLADPGLAVVLSFSGAIYLEIFTCRADELAARSKPGEPGPPWRSLRHHMLLRQAPKELLTLV